MKYTAKDIISKRICFENLTAEQFYKLQVHFQTLYPSKNYMVRNFDNDAKSFRFYPKINDEKNVMFFLRCSYTDPCVDEELIASASITFDQFNFEEDQYPKVMWVWDKKKKSEKVKRVVIMESQGKYWAWVDADTIESAEGEVLARLWDYAEDITEPEKFTKADIANLLNKDIDSFEIVL